ncbi:MAG: DHH family phosphoesterase [Selenomonadaceae bacterium]
MPRNLSAWIDSLIFLAAFFVMVLVVASYNVYMAAIGLVTFAVLAFFARERCRDRHEKFVAYCQNIISNVNAVSNYAIEKLPQAVLIVGLDEQGVGRVQWSNKALIDYTGAEQELGTPVTEFWPNMILKPIWGMSGEYVFTDGEGEEAKSYRAVYRPIAVDDDPQGFMAFYVEDVSGYENLRHDYEDSRIAIAYIQIDNYDEVLTGLAEAERTALLFEVNHMLDEWMKKIGGFVRKINDDMYLAVMERRSLNSAIEGKFEIIDKVRGLRAANKLPVTLSIGVAVADSQTTGEVGTLAQKELDLSLGRGGDQVAVLLDGKTQFYGGKTAAVEKHTRVKARVVAHALREQMEAADEVYVMGHRNEDFDAIGSALGVAKMACILKKPVHVVLSPMNDGIEKLTDKLLDKPAYKDLLIRENDMSLVTSPKSLLVVVDTHIPHLVAAPSLLERFSRIVVIDHHRRSESIIDGTWLLYIEPSSSSTSELITELLMYFADGITMSRMEATALYAGIVVDTKNFGVQTGVRTFEAAAYLRRAGADPVLIRNLFKSDYETNVTIAKAAASSKLYDGGLIVASCPSPQSNIQAIAAQAADSLLRIEGVRMSLVLFELPQNTIGVSARSVGELNVQVIMERFGGGGHQNVAGAQIKDAKLDDVMRDVVAAAQEYIKENG